MGAASSHEVRQIVDEAIVALRSEQHRHARNVMPVDDETAHCDEGDGIYYYYDDDNCLGSESDTDSDESGCEGSCCEDWESECCYQTMQCCVGDEKGGFSISHRSRGRSRDEEGRGKKKGKERKEERGCFAGCYPTKERGGWGGDVVGIARCPGEVSSGPSPSSPREEERRDLAWMDD